jgi:hypothetical protein
MENINNSQVNAVDIIENRLERIEKLVGNFEKHEDVQVILFFIRIRLLNNKIFRNFSFLKLLKISMINY